MVSSAGFASGIMICVRMRKWLAPSMSAASSRLNGMVLKNWRIRNTLNTFTAPHAGTIIGSHVFTQPAFENMTNIGIMVTCAGSIIVESTSTKHTSRSGQRNRAKL